CSGVYSSTTSSVTRDRAVSALRMVPARSARPLPVLAGFTGLTYNNRSSIDQQLTASTWRSLDTPESRTAVRDSARLTACPIEVRSMINGDGGGVWHPARPARADRRGRRQFFRQATSAAAALTSLL